LLALGSVAFAQPVQRANFVFIQGEGQGWNSTSVQLDPDVPGSKSSFFRTPGLERLAAGGIRFARFYAPSALCTPSRATYFTGKSPAQLHMTFVSLRTGPNTKLTPPEPLLEMPLEETTIAELLKSQGYATAHFGKWHVGRRNPPSRHGFDESDGATSNGGPENVRSPNPKEAYGITERGIDFMARQVKAGKPFYVQMSHYGGRGAQDARPGTYKKVLGWTDGREARNSGAAAVIFDMDITIGMVLDKLDELGVADRTYVIYTTDHGTPGRSNGPLAQGKGTIWEGGLRVPLFVRGPGIEAGALSRVRATGVDLFPTVADLAGVDKPWPEGIEGGSLAPVLMNSGQGAVKRPREEFVVHFPHYDRDPLGPASAILLGRFKLLRF
ncbi:MAG: sulfatase-like hydrolase/transferase, partial [bacterium]|nr:sulfatase-like hydrolase/transferase [bacterium]